MLLMLTKQKGQSVDALHHDKSAMTALMAASSNGSLTVLHIILEAGAKVLTTMLKRHIKEAQGTALVTADDLEAFAASLKG